MPDTEATAPPSTAAPTSSELAERAAESVTSGEVQPVTNSQPTETAQPEPKPKFDPEAIKNDPDFRNWFEQEAARRADQLAQKRLAREQARRRRELAKTAVQNEDADIALAIAKQVADEQDPEDVALMEWNAKADRVQPLLNRLLRVDAGGRATNPYYKELYEREGADKMNARYDKDPEAFYDWAETEIRKLEIQAELRKLAPDLYKSAATDAQNQALQSMPTPPTTPNGGGGMSDDDFIQAYAEGRSDDHARWRQVLARLS